MNLKKLFNWTKLNTDQVEETQNNENPPSIDPNQLSNVIPIASDLNLLHQESKSEEFAVKSTPVKGLLNSPELVEILKTNYFGLGQHNGACFRTLESLDLGKRSIISKFQNIIYEIIETKKNKINKLMNQLIAIDGLSNQMSEQIKQACKHLNVQVEILEDQLEKSDTQKGWVLKALNEYQIGYMKGVSDAIEFDLLSN